MKNRIKKARQHKNWTQQQLAEVSGVNVSVISRAERGVNKPSSETLMALSQVLEIDLSKPLMSSTTNFLEKKQHKTRKRYFRGIGTPLQNALETLTSKGVPAQEDLEKYEGMIGELLENGPDSVPSENRIEGPLETSQLIKAFEALEKKGWAVRHIILSFDNLMCFSPSEAFFIEELSMWGARISILDYSPVICLADGWETGDWDKVSILENSLPSLPLIPFKYRNKTTESPEESIEWADSTLSSFVGEERKLRVLDHESLHDLFQELKGPRRLLFHPKEYSWFRHLSRGFLDCESQRSLLEKGFMGTLEECPLLVRNSVPPGWFYLSTDKKEYLVQIVESPA